MYNKQIENRQIRVFISSTFQDMQDERNFLINRTFPKLKKLAAERDVTLTALDLRWGITKEEAQSGKVVEICLREIENSIPFFIGIIGRRYGWVPTREEMSESVTERFSEVNEYLESHLSVTEMEMQFGVLQREEDMHAYFFIKKRIDAIDNPKMLNQLKDKVINSKYPSTYYTSSEDLAAKVEKSFKNLLDQLFPRTELSDIDKIRHGQRSFMNQLCQSYIREERNFNALDTWLMNNDNHEFVVTGASGLGKSALLANWVREKIQEEHYNYNIVYHFTGNGGSESNSEYLLKVIKDEILDIYGWKEIFNDPNISLEELFSNVSSQGRKPLLIVIDAINQIVDSDNAKSLTWLPQPSQGIKVLYSTLENDRTMDVLKRRGCTLFTLQPLSLDQRSMMVRNYLMMFGKSLTNDQVERIVSNDKCENTLVLKTLLDELINYGIFKKLDNRIAYYLNTQNINDFFSTFLASYEQEFKQYGKDFVKNILSIISVSKDGLTESEIITISKIKPYQWSELYCSLIHSFCTRNGKISFGHTAIRDAIQKRYKLKKDHRKYRYSILKYCCSLFLKLEDANRVEEILYQSFWLRDLKLLYGFLKSPSMTGTIYRIDPMNCRNYWRLLRDNGYTFDCFVDLKDELITDIEDYEEFQSMLFNLRSMLHDFGEYEISYAIAKEQLLHWETNDKVPVQVLVRCYNSCAQECINITTMDSNNTKKDMYFHDAFKDSVMAIDLSQEHSFPEISTSLNLLAQISILARKYDSALKAAEKAVALGIKQYGLFHHETAVYYSTLGNVYDVTKNYDKAIECHQHILNIYQTIYGENDEHLIIANYNLAETLYTVHRYEDALHAIESSIKIIKDVYGDDYFDMDSYTKFRDSILNCLKS